MSTVVAKLLVTRKPLMMSAAAVTLKPGSSAPRTWQETSASRHNEG
jgi:hypothetical protein